MAEALGKFLSTPIEVLNIAGTGLGSSGFRELQNLIEEELKLVQINIRLGVIPNIMLLLMLNVVGTIK